MAISSAIGVTESAQGATGTLQGNAVLIDETISLLLLGVG